MERDPLNFFSPYERLAAGHENQLTRALLVLLRMSPISHAEWLRMVAPERSLGMLPPASFATQRRAVRDPQEDDEPAELVSVFLAPEKPQSGGGVVAESDRGQVLDGIIEYGELVVVVENKVFDADDLQARAINLTDARVDLAEGQVPVIVLWRDLLERLIALRERELVGGAEARVLDDFLVYVEDHFPQIGPFRDLALCEGVDARQTRRLRQILSVAAAAEAIIHSHGPRVDTPAPNLIGGFAYLRLADEEDAIELAVYPADTLTQAREFYANEIAVRGVRQLAQRDDWRVKPNFHFGHMQRGFCWTSGEIELIDYLDLWQAEIAATGSVPRESWDRYWMWLEAKQVAVAHDRIEFDRCFTQTNRMRASPRPGLAISRPWSISEAEKLDRRGVFAEAVRDALNHALRALGEELIAQGS